MGNNVMITLQTTNISVKGTPPVPCIGWTPGVVVVHRSRSYHHLLRPSTAGVDEGRLNTTDAVTLKTTLAQMEKLHFWREMLVHINSTTDWVSLSRSRQLTPPSSSQPGHQLSPFSVAPSGSTTEQLFIYINRYLDIYLYLLWVISLLSRTDASGTVKYF